MTSSAFTAWTLSWAALADRVAARREARMSREDRLRRQLAQVTSPRDIEDLLATVADLQDPDADLIRAELTGRLLRQQHAA